MPQLNLTPACQRLHQQQIPGGAEGSRANQLKQSNWEQRKTLNGLRLNKASKSLNTELKSPLQRKDSLLSTK